MLENKLVQNFQDDKTKISILTAVSKVLNSKAEIQMEGLPIIEIKEKLSNRIHEIYAQS
jgi:hypothetical protein